MVKNVYAIDGIDRLGKSTLIQGILEKLGFYQVIHFSKPQKLKAYDGTMPPIGVPKDSVHAFHYQVESFRNSMILARSGARIIFDRWHLGEYVYSPIYRGYSGDYVFQQELTAGIDICAGIRLILLTEDLENSKHFIDDGNSLGPAEKRYEEQQRFIDAFNKSSVGDKRIICVTDKKTGKFRAKEDILSDALE